MKRLVALLLVISAIICLVACGGKNSNNSADISKYANDGRIPEYEYKIGDDAKKVIEKLEKKNSKDDTAQDNYYEILPGTETSKIFTYKAHYIYDNSSNKITKIIAFDDAFGYKLGTDRDTIFNAQNEFNIKGNDVELSTEEVKDISGTSECTYLEYEFDKNTVVFAFENNCLFATEIKVNEK